jgi:alcohol dehydrogenase
VRAVVYHGPNRVAWDEVDEPKLADSRAALVRPIAVALCDLDWITVRGLSPFAPPFPLGHEGVARVEAVGAEVSSVRPGDLAIVPFQISCGTCAACAAGFTGNCATVRPRTAMYGIGAAGGDRGGLLADCVLVPFADAMLVRVPDGLDPIAVASASDNIADGYRCVAPFLAERPGAEVLVLGGLGFSVALYAAACAVALGASRVDYVDADAGRRARAEQAGAHALEALPEKIVPSYPIVVDGSGSIPRLHAAIAATAPEGICVVPAIYFGDTTPLPLYRMYVKGMRLQTGRVHARAAIPRVLELIAAGRIHPEAITSQVVAWEDAPEAILAGAQTKLVIERVATP